VRGAFSRDPFGEKSEIWQTRVEAREQVAVVTVELLDRARKSGCRIAA